MPHNAARKAPALRVVANERSAEPPWESIDPGIRHEVRVLWENGIETHESCQGTVGHPFPDPTVRFRGGHAEGFKALAIALQFGLPVTALRRYWEIIDGAPTGPHWEMIFCHTNGGGIHPVESGTGKIVWEWGGAKENRRNRQ